MISTRLVKEVHTNIKSEYRVTNFTTTNEDLAELDFSSTLDTPSGLYSVKNATHQGSLEAIDTASSTLTGYQQAFTEILNDFDIYAQETGFQDFWNIVYPRQAQLVLAYTVAGLTSLGCPVASLEYGEVLPSIQHLPKHQRLVKQLYNILADAGLVTYVGNSYIRTDKAVDPTKADIL